MTDIPKLSALDAETERLVAKVQEVADAIRNKRMAYLLPIIGAQFDFMREPPTNPKPEQIDQMLAGLIMSVLMRADTADQKTKAEP